jgi:hypothetical protein
MVGTSQDEAGTMVLKKDRGTRSQTLSLRLDPKTKFTLEFVARIKGQTLTTIVERAIRDSCDQVTIGSNYGNEKFSWQSFWDPDEGVRTLKLLACNDYTSTYDEDDLKAFVKEHWEFFYFSENAEAPHRAFVRILWPKIDDYRRIWHEQRDSDNWAAGKAMAADLLAAKVSPPMWPRQSQKKTDSEPISGLRNQSQKKTDSEPISGLRNR